MDWKGLSAEMKANCRGNGHLAEGPCARCVERVFEMLDQEMQQRARRQVIAELQLSAARYVEWPQTRRVLLDIVEGLRIE